MMSAENDLRYRWWTVMGRRDDVGCFLKLGPITVYTYRFAWFTPDRTFNIGVSVLNRWALENQLWWLG